MKKVKENANSTKKIACIFNYPSHYRENIFLKMEQILNCDFYFGNIEEGNIKKINSQSFSNSVHNLKTIKLFSGFSWIKGMVVVLFKKYNTFILTADPLSCQTGCF